MGAASSCCWGYPALVNVEASKWPLELQSLALIDEICAIAEHIQGRAVKSEAQVQAIIHHLKSLPEQWQDLGPPGWQQFRGSHWLRLGQGFSNLLNRLQRVRGRLARLSTRPLLLCGERRVLHKVMCLLTDTNNAHKVFMDDVQATIAACLFHRSVRATQTSHSGLQNLPGAKPGLSYHAAVPQATVGAAGHAPPRILAISRTYVNEAAARAAALSQTQGSPHSTSQQPFSSPSRQYLPAQDDKLAPHNSPAGALLQSGTFQSLNSTSSSQPYMVLLVQPSATQTLASASASLQRALRQEGHTVTSLASTLQASEAHNTPAGTRLRVLQDGQEPRGVPANKRPALKLDWLSTSLGKQEYADAIPAWHADDRMPALEHVMAEIDHMLAMKVYVSHQSGSLRDAARAGEPGAQHWLANTLWDAGQEADAMRWWKRAAAKGWATSAMMLGHVAEHQAGCHVQQNFLKASLSSLHTALGHYTHAKDLGFTEAGSHIHRVQAAVEQLQTSKQHDWWSGSTGSSLTCSSDALWTSTVCLGSPTDGLMPFLWDGLD